MRMSQKCKDNNAEIVKETTPYHGPDLVTIWMSIAQYRLIETIIWREKELDNRSGL
jgi:hypothetical protein